MRKAVGEQEGIGDSRRTERDGKQDVSDKAEEAAESRPRGEDRGGAQREHKGERSTCYSSPHVFSASCPSQRSLRSALDPQRRRTPKASRSRKTLLRKPNPNPARSRTEKAPAQIQNPKPLRPPDRTRNSPQHRHRAAHNSTHTPNPSQTALPNSLHRQKQQHN